jgi:uridine kinase
MREPSSVIAIAGASGSGKTELARQLQRRLAAMSPVIVPLDAYYRGFEHLPVAIRATQNFDHPTAVDHVLLARQLSALAVGGAVEMPVYDYVTHSRLPTGRRVGPGRVIVVEGLFALYWKEIRDLLDLAVFIDADRGLCLERRLARDTRIRGRSEESVRGQFEETVVPMFERFVRPTRRFADLVLQGDRPVEDLVDELIQAWGPPSSNASNSRERDDD